MDPSTYPFVTRSLSVFRSFKEFSLLFMLLFGAAVMLPLGALMLLLGGIGTAGAIIACWLILVGSIYAYNRLAGRRVERLLVEQPESVEWIYCREVRLKSGTATVGSAGYQIRLIDEAGKRYKLPCKTPVQATGIVAELRRLTLQAQVDAEGTLFEAGIRGRNEQRLAG